MSHLANTLVVVETGGSLPEPDLHGENTVIVVSDVSHGTENLEQAVSRRLDVISKNGDVVERAIFAVTEATERAALSERLPVVRLLLSCLSPSTQAELILASEGDCSPDFKHELFSLVDTLMHDPVPSSVPIRLRFSTSQAPQTAPSARRSTSRFKRNSRASANPAALRSVSKCERAEREAGLRETSKQSPALAACVAF